MASKRMTPKAVSLPYYKQQTPFTCSLACLRMVLESIGRKFTEMELARIIGFKPDIGFSAVMMGRLCDIIGVEYGFYFNLSLDELNELVSDGFYPITLVKAGVLYSILESEYGHYLVIKDITKRNVTINDPDQEYGGENKQISIEKFLDAWKYFHNFVFVVKGEKK